MCRMLRSPILGVSVVAAVLAIGCNGGTAASGDAGATGGTVGASGTGGAGTGGTTGAAGARGTGGSVGAGGSVGGTGGTYAADCNTGLMTSGNLVYTTIGGPFYPMGGVIADGIYDLVSIACYYRGDLIGSAGQQVTIRVTGNVMDFVVINGTLPGQAYKSYMFTMQD